MEFITSKKRKFFLSNQEWNVVCSIASFSKWKEATKKSLEKTCVMHETADMETNYSKCLLWAANSCARDKQINYENIKGLIAKRNIEDLSKFFVEEIMSQHLEEFTLDILYILREAKVNLC